MDPAIVSVIVSGLVAVSSLLVPIIVDARKSKRETNAGRLERMNKTTLELLAQLSHFRHWLWTDIEESAGRPPQQVYTDLRSKHYAWERAIWSSLNPGERERVKKLRKRFESVHTPDDLTRDASSSDVSDLSDEILKLAYIAIDGER